MATDNGKFYMGIRDGGNKLGGIRVNTEILTAVNMADMITARDAFIDAIEDLLAGRIEVANLSLVKDFGGGLPTAKYANRDAKLVVHMLDNVTGEPYHFTIPSFKNFDDNDFRRQPGTDFIDLTTAWMATRIAAINAFVRSPEASHDGTLQAITVQK